MVQLLLDEDVGKTTAFMPMDSSYHVQLVTLYMTCELQSLFVSAISSLLSTLILSDCL
jgi:hypothetical protein